MKKITIFDRVLLLLAVLLSAYQLVRGIEGLGKLPILAFTIAFGVILVAALLLIILGYDALDNPWVVILSTIIPLGLSSGLVAEFLPGGLRGFATFSLAGLAGVILTRLSFKGQAARLWVTFVHGVAGLTIVALPILLVLRDASGPGLLLVSLGGALISGMGLLMLIFHDRINEPVRGPTLLRFFAPVYFLTCLALVMGFWLA